MADSSPDGPTGKPDSFCRNAVYPVMLTEFTLSPDWRRTLIRSLLSAVAARCRKVARMSSNTAFSRPRSIPRRVSRPVEDLSYVLHPRRGRGDAHGHLDGIASPVAGGGVLLRELLLVPRLQEGFEILNELPLLRDELRRLPGRLRPGEVRPVEPELIEHLPRRREVGPADRTLPLLERFGREAAAPAVATARAELVLAG